MKLDQKSKSKCDQTLDSIEETAENVFTSDRTALVKGIAHKFQPARKLLLERKSATMSSAAALAKASKERAPPNK